ncbi:MAG: hypothetical protein Q9217_006307 [Psora testacea]
MSKSASLQTLQAFQEWFLANGGQHYLWSATILSSRSFPGSALPQENLVSPVLIPGLDLLNHSSLAKVAWDWNGSTCSIKTDGSLAAGSEIFNNYGPKSNEELLIGYGFCIPNNAVETFGLGFSRAVSRHVQAVKRARRDKNEDSDSQKGEIILSDDSSQVAEQHWVRLKPMTPTEEKSSPGQTYHEFSPHFIEHFSIVLENRREHYQHNTGRGSSAWGSSQSEVTFGTSTDLSRNKFHVLNALIMLLEKSRAEIRQHDTLLLNKRPTNQRQRDAAIYRSNQLTILDDTLTELNQTLNAILRESLANGVLRLEHALTIGPKILVKDFRSLLHVALGTRDPQKIRQRGGDESAFTFWLCGLWVLHKTAGVDDGRPFGPQLASWLDFLGRTYDHPPRTDDELPISQSPSLQAIGSASDPTGDLSIARSYLKAIDVTIEKYPKSLYKNKAIITVPLMVWCLNIVREEVVRCPNLTSEGGEEEDEYIIFLENDRKQP